jgi:hypothetical protein
MKTAVLTTVTVIAIAIAMATVAFGAQVSDTVSTVGALSDVLSRGLLQTVQSGDVAGVQSLPSTSTAATDGVAIVALAVVAIAGGFALIRKAITER